jgi:hypothetical protein
MMLCVAYAPERKLIRACFELPHHGQQDAWLWSIRNSLELAMHPARTTAQALEISDLLLVLVEQNESVVSSW